MTSLFVSFVAIAMQWLMYEVFPFIGAFQAIEGFASNILFNTSTFGVHPSITCITLHLKKYAYIICDWICKNCP